MLAKDAKEQVAQLREQLCTTQMELKQLQQELQTLNGELGNAARTEAEKNPLYRAYAGIAECNRIARSAEEYYSRVVYGGPDGDDKDIVSDFPDTETYLAPYVAELCAVATRARNAQWAIYDTCREKLSDKFLGDRPTRRERLNEAISMYLKRLGEATRELKYGSSDLVIPWYKIDIFETEAKLRIKEFETAEDDQRHYEIQDNGDIVLYEYLHLEDTIIADSDDDGEYYVPWDEVRSAERALETMAAEMLPQVQTLVTNRLGELAHVDEDETDSEDLEWDIECDGEHFDDYYTSDVTISYDFTIVIKIKKEEK